MESEVTEITILTKILKGNICVNRFQGYHIECYKFTMTRTTQKLLIGTVKDLGATGTIDGDC